MTKREQKVDEQEVGRASHRRPYDKPSVVRETAIIQDALASGPPPPPEED